MSVMEQERKSLGKWDKVDEVIEREIYGLRIWAVNITDFLKIKGKM